MQITLVQAQIEEAIRQFVGSRLNLQIGETLHLDLRATRGDDGYTCVVTVNTNPNINTNINANILYPASRSLNITENVENARIEEETGDQPESQPEGPLDPEPEAAVQEDAQTAEPTTKKKSIFAGLEKPVNTSNADNEAA